MADYQQLHSHDGSISSTVLRRSDTAYIPDDPANRDRQTYLQWVAEGNVPDPPDPLPDPPEPAPLTLAADPEGDLDAVTLRYHEAALRGLRDPATQAHAELDARVTALEEQLRVMKEAPAPRPRPTNPETGGRPPGR